VGPARAKDLIFSARILDGQTAHALGVVEHYAPAYNGGEGGDEALMAAVASARQMAGNGARCVEPSDLLC
jgi:enoyl-CoA hydratase/carnithine racemase